MITPLYENPNLEAAYDADELDAVLNAMIVIDQPLTFAEEYKALQLGEPVNKSSIIARLSPFLAEGGLIKMRTRLEYCDNLPKQAKYQVILEHPAKFHLFNFLSF